MLSKEIRTSFLDYFEKRGHKIVPSSSLVPVDDPTLLFTNAGMVQFKDVFLGREVRTYSKAATCQKCVRAGGKHNDLENVGFTKRHHTFLEMLGNFSFGDYFKEEAITYAWDFLTNVLQLPKERIYVTVFREDDEAEALWRSISGIPSTRIVRLGEKDNFWSMGDTGPCGPCSEIIIDRGENARCGPGCALGVCDCDRWLEIWNLVFMQFLKDGDGKMTLLPRPSIDTGMGLERITSVLQDKDSAFDTDLFTDILSAIEKTSGKVAKGESEAFPFRVIADHVRACVFLASDGVTPSNEGRGYVMRRILRRAVRFGLELAMEEPFLKEIVPAVIKTMGAAYPELIEKMSYIEELLFMDEERFQTTLLDGQKRADQMVEETKGRGEKLFSGQDAFVLYDTFGFPLDLTKDIARKKDLDVDEIGFLECMREQKERSRADKSKKDGEKLLEDMLVDLPPTVFLGYRQLESSATVMRILKGENEVPFLKSGEEGVLILNKTPFYAVGGGQESDTGEILGDLGKSRLKVNRVSKVGTGAYLHFVKSHSGKISLGDEVSALVDVDRRTQLSRHHTATHILHAVLKKVLGGHVEQSGSLVGGERLRFDFSHLVAVSPDELREIEREANLIVLKNLPVTWKKATLEEAKKEGTIALFDEKYGEKVRIVQILGISKELCGGTHVERTGEIGQIQITAETSLSAGVRRLEAVAGTSALSRYQKLEKALDSLAKTLRVPKDEVGNRVLAMLDDISNLRKESKKAQRVDNKDVAKKIAEKALEVGNLKVATSRLDGMEMRDLVSLGDVLKDLGSSIVILGSAVNERALLCVMATDEAVRLGVAAQKIVKKGAEGMEGSGGGKPNLAQAGSKKAELLDSALLAAQKEAVNQVRDRKIRPEFLSR